MTTQNLQIGSSQDSLFRSILRGKTRIAMAWLFAALLIFSARQLPVWPGIIVCFLGATLRFWASGFLRKDNRPAVGGPYAFVRNPLYLGTYLMAIGTALAIEAWLLVIAVSILFAIVYHYTILDEETKLAQIFGQSYEIYKQSVPRFFPRAWPPLLPASRATLLSINPELSHLNFDWKLALKNKAYEAYVSLIALMGFVALLATVWQRFGE